MTGEITLQGQILPVGGLKRKLLAAHRAGIKKVLVPKLNEADLDDLPEAVRDEIEIVLVEDVREVLQEALTPPETASGEEDEGTETA